MIYDDDEDERRRDTAETLEDIKREEEYEDEDFQNEKASKFDPTNDDGTDVIGWLRDVTMRKYTFKTMRDTGEIWYYDRVKRIYRPGGLSLIEEYCQIANPRVRTNQVNEVVNQISRYTRTERSEFNSDSDILNLDNCLLDKYTLQVYKRTPAHLSTVRIPIRYDPKAKCREIPKFFKQVLKKEDIPAAYELLGYCLETNVRFQKSVMCYGKGSNGKSVFLDLIKHFLGEKNVSHMSLQQLCDERFATSKLFGKLANTYADLPLDKIKGQLFKSLSSGDDIEAEFKHQNPFSFKSHATMFFSANRIPDSEDDSYAYFRRWILLVFPNLFEGENDDRDKIDKLTTPGELSGLLNLALEGLKRLRKNGRFTNAKTVEEIQLEYQRNSNTVRDFISSKCDINEDATTYTICRDLYHAYVGYCKDKNLDTLAPNAFGMEIADRHVVRESKRVNHVKEYVYMGIRLKGESSS